MDARESSETENAVHCGQRTFRIPELPVTLISAWKGEQQVALAAPLASAQGLRRQWCSQSLLLFPPI